MAKASCAFYVECIMSSAKGTSRYGIAKVRTVFAAPNQKTAKNQLYTVVEQLKGRFPKAMEILENGCENVLQNMEFPQEHWAQLHSTNPLERLNKEIRRRTDVVSIS